MILEKMVTRKLVTVKKIRNLIKRMEMIKLSLVMILVM